MKIQCEIEWESGKFDLKELELCLNSWGIKSTVRPLPTIGEELEELDKDNFITGIGGWKQINQGGVNKINTLIRWAKAQEGR